ncbi:MAG: hypothetical protein DRI75_07650 [Bacteroidetes bacterium]|nr:MAG: hypothetical protein DRI75_07650 [Bacteroidota bacterium]
MKTIVTILILSLTGVCNAQFTTVDEKIHLAAGALMSATTYTLVYTSTKSKKKAFWYSLGTTTLASILKEVYDSSKDNNRFDTNEAIATTIGGFTVSMTLEIFIGKRKKKKTAYTTL